MGESIAKITKGTGIAFIGTIAALVMGFAGRLIIARSWTEAEYGVFALTVVVFNMCVVLATLGMEMGTSRNIGYALGLNDSKKARNVARASIQLGLFSSVLLGLVLFLIADSLATGVFHDPAVGPPLKALALGIPFFTMINVFVSIFQGHANAMPRAFFQNVLRNVLFLLILAPILLLSLSFQWVFYAYVISLGIPCLLLVLYAQKSLALGRMAKAIFSPNPALKELFFFSAPLLGVTALQVIMGWADTLIIGSEKDSTAVGLYNVAFPLASFVTAPMTAMLLVYIPVTSGLYAQGALAEIKQSFSILTKWLFAAALPLFLVLFLFPVTVLSALFGGKYAPAADALQILSLGGIIGTLLGPNAATLIAMGKTRFVVWATLGGVILNVGLNLALIPMLGIEGAAIAATSTQASIGLIRQWKLHSLTRIQPFGRKLVVPGLLSLAIIVPLSLALDHFFIIRWWMLPLLFMFFYLIYGMATILTRSLDSEDVAVLLALERRSGINAAPAKRVLRRFVKTD